MDSTTTLFTFMLHTTVPTRTVQLLGSWDNFAKRYPMKKDARRGPDQWRGCFCFTDITCDGDSRGSIKRDGGLMMGETYYYYYELEDGTETYDTSLPFTNTCQYLPGQPVNLLSVPVERPQVRSRRASFGECPPVLNTLNPEDKYRRPKPVRSQSSKQLLRLDTSAGVVGQNKGDGVDRKPEQLWLGVMRSWLKMPIFLGPELAIDAPVNLLSRPRSPLDSVTPPSSESEEPPTRTFLGLEDLKLALPPAVESSSIVLKPAQPIDDHVEDEPIDDQNLGILLPRSHFSLNTVSTTLQSPTESTFDTSSPSMEESHDGYATADESVDFGMTFMESPVQSKPHELSGSPIRRACRLGNDAAGGCEHGLGLGESIPEEILEMGSPLVHYRRASGAGGAQREDSPHAGFDTLDDMAYLGDFIST